MQLFGLPFERVWWWVFGAAFITAIVSETFWPFRALTTPTTRRWLGNGVLMALSSGLIACVYGLTGVVLAAGLQGSRYGFLNRLPLPSWMRFALGFLAFDLCQYLIHRLLHSRGFLWRFHQVHHSETDLDATTGLRFHPGEALISQAGMLIVIALLGAPPLAVLAAALAALTQDLFTHANVSLPSRVDRCLRWVIITPGLHRTHHSILVVEQNKNFGTILSVWDRLFGTYWGEFGNLSYGLREYETGSLLSPGRLLAMPFRDPTQTSIVSVEIAANSSVTASTLV